MKPTWQDSTGQVQLYLGDCLAVLPTLEAGSVDVLTDPPFGIGNFVQDTGNVRGERVQWNDRPPPRKCFDEIKRVSRYRIIWGANYFNCFEDCGALVWVKNQTLPNFSKAAIASVNWGSKIEVLSLTWNGSPQRKFRFSDHPCENPVELYLWCLSQIPGDAELVLDPFMGSGTTAVACIRTGRKFIGIEIDPRYFAIAVKRIEKALADDRAGLYVAAEKHEQAELFTEPKP